MARKPTPAKIINTYIKLTLTSTFAASFIWGVNTLFLLDAGLSITEAFAANAFFTIGLVLFEVPTGVVADAWGRRTSYLLGAITLLLSTVLYYLMWHTKAPFAAWAVSSAIIGLGFTFFTGAVEAWLVDALSYTKYKKSLDEVFAKGQIASGAAMLTGTIIGGVVAQNTSLGVPYIMRMIMLVGTFAYAYKHMHDYGYTPDHSHGYKKQIKSIVKSSVVGGLGQKSIRYVLLTSPFLFGVGAFAFYAMQPYLLELYGDNTAFAVAAVAAAGVAGAQIIGGLSVKFLGTHVHKRTSILVSSLLASSTALVLLGFTSDFYLALGALFAWAIAGAAAGPVRQAYLNKLISSENRATIISFDALLGSAGASGLQPMLGKAADVWSYGTAYVLTGFIQLLALPLLFLAQKQHSKADDN